MMDFVTVCQGGRGDAAALTPFQKMLTLNPTEDRPAGLRRTAENRGIHARAGRTRVSVGGGWTARGAVSGSTYTLAGIEILSWV
jgi:hypothetical protein